MYCITVLQYYPLFYYGNVEGQQVLLCEWLFLTHPDSLKHVILDCSICFCGIHKHLQFRVYRFKSKSHIIEILKLLHKVVWISVQPWAKLALFFDATLLALAGRRGGTLGNKDGVRNSSSFSIWNLPFVRSNRLSCLFPVFYTWKMRSNSQLTLIIV